MVPGRGKFAKRWMLTPTGSPASVSIKLVQANQDNNRRGVHRRSAAVFELTQKIAPGKRSSSSVLETFASRRFLELACHKAEASTL